MSLVLGPIPLALREIVQRWIQEDRCADTTRRSDGFCISGDCSYRTFLHAAGEVFRWRTFDDSYELIPDGPEKIAEIVIGARSHPELSQWLPSKPIDFLKCEHCDGTGKASRFSEVSICLQCSGLGWSLK